MKKTSPNPKTKNHPEFRTRTEPNYKIDRTEPNRNYNIIRTEPNFKAYRTEPELEFLGSIPISTEILQSLFLGNCK